MADGTSYGQRQDERSMDWLRRTHPEAIQAAEAEYERQESQTIPRMRERGGLGIGEVAMYLHQALVRNGATSEYLTPTCDREGE